MKIGFDVSQTAEDMAGCGFFSKQIISHLLEMDKENQYILYPLFYGYRHPDYKKAFQSNQQNVSNYFVNSSLNNFNQKWEDNLDKSELLGNPDIIHSNNFSFPSNVSAKKVMTIYDLGYLDCPEYTTEANRLVCLEGAFEASIYADHIVTISEFSKQCFMKYFPHYPEKRISVLYLGSRPTLKKITDTESIEKVKNKFGLCESFWLGVGTIEPRKNYRLLLEAYAQLVKDQNESKPLYIAGGKGWMEQDIQDRINDLGISDKIQFLGYVSDDELSVLYSKCFAFIYPSLYEGFGLPVLEAMSCGAPVITSNISSIPEVVGNAGLLINPIEVKSLLEAMVTIESNNDLRNELILKSEIQAQKFSWYTAAEQMLDIYQKVMITESWYKKNQ
ncbi:glycosyl transferase family 1 [Paenibacillus marchantiophytorum]|uniref:Glycosyl transferase family 1 n=1 Tax=Paenibacillus marchantiophytorum TaxID=1619310 RepID=A0ABQ2BS26_9BACL|nr:glycosyltransferase family 1 protein [Paenibacillus marchantiophytorum]GGI46242.1 glycosyl transferase family 1 [Paenibacillus marchantiophytorum]